MDARAISLNDRYDLEEGRVFMNGLHALTRLPMVQMRRDKAAGLNTAAFISGYRGSPLGGYDQELMRQKKRLDAQNIVFQPGVNEDLAATAVWGTQQATMSPGSKYDGVLGIWYGKGPGVARSGDVFQHANAAGTSAHGGVLCLAGDDHAAKSSTVPHQSEHFLSAAVIPTLYPSSIHEFVEMGLLGIAMSRYSGCWVGMKVIADTVETTATVDLRGEDRIFAIPDDFEIPNDGLNIRWPDDRWVQDHRLQTYKGYAAVAFGRANNVDRIVIDSPQARFGIIASGKAYEDTREALRQLGVTEDEATRIGLRVYKVGMPWPLEPEGVRHFAEGLEEVLVIEERREVIEFQIKQQLFNWRADVRPHIIGKFDHRDQPNLPLDVELTTGVVARAIGLRLLELDLDESIAARIRDKVAWFDTRADIRKAHQPPVIRKPYFCAGCPHNTSTNVPEGSRVGAGIGCHFMVTWMDRNDAGFSQMGGEGAQWQGMAHFTDEKHQFINLGDGTYFHSGLLAIRQGVASGVNHTYKILYNDAVAMTGGQPIDGSLTPQQITHQLHAEGVGKTVLVTDEPDLYTASELAAGVEIRHRDDLDTVMRDLRETPGCTAIVFVQTCAAEKRRRRKRGLMPDPDKRIIINPAVCEGCGDCSVQSNCVAVEPLETAMGRKRRINQSSCNKDFSCVKGFCPSFVTVSGASLRKRASTGIDPLAIAAPATPVTDLTRPWNIAITGVGGTGVLTIGAVLGMAAHLEGKASMILDMAGLAQKGGAVFSYVRIGEEPDAVTSPRIVSGGADLLFAADAVVAASTDGVVLCEASRTRAVVNTHLTPVADFIKDRDLDFRNDLTIATIRKTVQGDDAFLDFTALAEAACGDAIMTNIMMLGYACQTGALPVAMPNILRAIEMNGVAVEANVAAFHWGRKLAAEPGLAAELLAADAVEATPQTLDDLIAHREAHLTDYQNARLARRYRKRVEKVRAWDEDAAFSVAKNYSKLLSYKDEYEVARLYTDGRFAEQIAETFEEGGTLTFHLAPPVFNSGTDAKGRPKKKEYGESMLRNFRLLAKLKRLRGTPLDIFGYTEERKAERALIKQYERDINTVMKGQPGPLATALLTLPDAIRGFGPVKAEAMADAAVRREDILARMKGDTRQTVQMAAE